MDNDWNTVRRELDKSDHFEAICNSPWYSDAVYDKFSDEEFARRHEAARELMVRDGLESGRRGSVCSRRGVGKSYGDAVSQGISEVNLIQ